MLTNDQIDFILQNLGLMPMVFNPKELNLNEIATELEALKTKTYRLKTLVELLAEGAELKIIKPLSSYEAANYPPTCWPVFIVHKNEKMKIQTFLRAMKQITYPTDYQKIFYVEVK